MEKIRLAIVGVGNCASSLVQGIYFYKDKKPDECIGLMHYEIGGYKPSDIEIVAAFDVDKRKVGKDISDAIFENPNCTKTFQSDIPETGINVSMGKILDGYAKHMSDYPEEARFVLSKKKQPTLTDIAKILTYTKADVLINYLPVGSEKAVRFYASAALEARVGFVNCMPVFIASDENEGWQDRFYNAKIPIIGDDIKSQIGATIIHRSLTKLFQDRGVKIDRTYQLNVGGNTDFLNMLERARLKSKKISKTESVQSQMSNPLKSKNIHIGPSDHVPWLDDNKVAFIRMEGRIFGDVPINMDIRLSVEDSPNSAGVAIDAIRCCKLAMDRGVSGPLTSPSSYFMKHPPEQFSDEKARETTEEFISGKRER